MDRAKESIRHSVDRGYRKLWNIIDKRWDKQLYRDIHATGYFLNPAIQYSNNTANDNEVLSGFRYVVSRLESDISKELNIDREVEFFQMKLGVFGSDKCENGHVACSLCCTKLPQNKCPTCSRSINFTRCRALEKIIKSIKSPCIYSKYGCNRTLSYIDMLPHQETCTNAPCFCPMSNCTFCGFPEQVSTHFGTYHGDSAIEFQYEKEVKISLDREKPFIVLREEHGFLFLLLNERFMDMGNSLSVACIQQSCKECDFVYELMVSGAESLLQLKASAENVRKWVGIYPRKVLLLVPEKFCPSDVDISVNVCIQKKRTGAVVG